MTPGAAFQLPRLGDVGTVCPEYTDGMAVLLATTPVGVTAHGGLRSVRVVCRLKSGVQGRCSEPEASPS